MWMPFQILSMWMRGLFSLVLLGAGLSLLLLWYNHREKEVILPGAVAQQSSEINQVQQLPAGSKVIQTVYWEFGFNRETAFLLGGLGLLIWALGGNWIFSPRLWRRRGGDEPRSDLIGQKHTIHAADGSTIQVEMFGPADGTPLVFIHGWGQDRDEWYYAKKSLGKTHRLILWDLPGLGQSTRPADRDWSLEKLANHLHQVISLAGGRPVILIGHSIGGMIALTYCRVFSRTLAATVQALVLAHTTYTNPVHTTSGAKLYQVLQKPLLEPLCHLMIWLAPLFWVMNWLSYLNGSAHRSTDKDSFSGNETRGQLDFIAKYICTSPPDVVARGMLAMFRYDATATLATIPIPVLVVAGDQDSTCLPQASELIARTVPHGKLVVLSPAKHCGLFEHHADFHATVTRFLQESELATAQGSSLPVASGSLLPNG